MSKNSGFIIIRLDPIIQNSLKTMDSRLRGNDVFMSEV